METDQVSVSALISAYVRGYHALHANPKIFDDSLAMELFTEAERASFGRNLAESLKFFAPEMAAGCPDPEAALAAVMRVQLASITLSRSRYAEDSLELAVLRGTRQYVILGAGLDTFAFRRPDLLRQLKVFEVDHPATQSYKRKRMADLGWEQPASLTYLSLDFTKDDLAAGLSNAGFDPRALTCFCWLGVTYYLEREAVHATLRAIAQTAPPGSTVIFDYPANAAFVAAEAARRMQLMQAAARRSGEPMSPALDPATLGAELAQLGMRLRENLSPAEIEARFFAGRADDYHAFEHVYFATAEVE